MKSKHLHFRFSYNLLPLQPLIILPLILLFLLFTIESRTIYAATLPVKITACELNNDSRVIVKAEAADLQQLSGTTCYLFALPAGRTRLAASDRPVSSRKARTAMTFRIPLKNATSSTRLYSYYLVACRNASGNYEAVSNIRVVSNPQTLAKYNYQFPTPLSKKGLQVNAQMLEDAAELNVKHAAINMVFTEMIATAGERNSGASYSYSYHGKTYWFRKSVIAGYDRQLRALKETDSVNSAILLLGWRSDLTNLIYPSGRSRGHAFYAWNTRDASAREYFQAVLSFLGQRYSAKKGTNGRIVNWIIGNEVNNYGVYNYAGQLSLSSYARAYAQAFRLASQTLTSIYSNARIYISLDHLWNYHGVANAFSSRDTLEAFAKQMAKYGGVHWNLAFHPYASPPTEPKFWENADGWASQALTATVITMSNLNILTDYIRESYGKDTRIILSEQGYTSVQYGKKVEKEQAAAIVYSYLLTQSNDMVDSFIMNRHVDHQVEIRQGLSLGVWTTAPGATERANTKKLSWKVFKYMDSTRLGSVSKFALKEIGIKSWKEGVSGYSKKNAQTYSASTARLNIVTAKAAGNGKKLPAKWKSYGAVSGIRHQNQGNTFTVFHNGSRNRNALWGFTQTFKSLSFEKNPSLCFTAKASGSGNGKAILKLRLFSRANILEAQRTIPTGKELSFCVNLSDWEHRGAVTRMQILLVPYKTGTWNSGASLTIR